MGFDEVCPQVKRQEIPTRLSLLYPANLNHWTAEVNQLKYITCYNQVLSTGDKTIYNKNCENVHENLKLRQNNK
jgi:hypothetical protein